MAGRYNFWFMAKPAEDLPGQWVAHCLDIDVVTQGTSLQHAIEMICEAVAMVAMEDRQAGRDVRQRHCAPEEYYEVLFSIIRNGERGDMSDLLRKPEVVALAGQLQLAVIDSRTEPHVPAAWEIDAARRAEMNSRYA